jgi:hypothetical protein
VIATEEHFADSAERATASTRVLEREIGMEDKTGSGQFAALLALRLSPAYGGRLAVIA